jgi:Rab proteins geranylgeranyltransferase component A
VTRPCQAPDSGVKLSFPRAYALSLSPQIIHANSRLLSQLVSSRCYRQLEFLAVGSFFIFKPASEPAATPTLARIPSTREDVFSSTDLSARVKRQLMKFLKLVLSYEEETSLPQWQEYADRPLAELLSEKMSLDEGLQTYITTLTLSLDGRISTKDGLAKIHRHMTSMGLFGPGFAAVYPKWGGGSEIAQVGCRAGAVGGGVYMLGTGIKEIRGDGTGGEVELELSEGTVVNTKTLFRGSEEVPAGKGIKISRLVAIVGSPLASLFEPTLEGAPTPAAAVLALPPRSVETSEGSESTYPIYAIAHSSDTGECPAGQSKLCLMIPSPQFFFFFFSITKIIQSLSKLPEQQP